MLETQESTTRRERPMRAALIILATMAASPLLVSTPAKASYDYPWCLQSYSGGGRYCDYATKAQCDATASGQMAMCEKNYSYLLNPPSEPQPAYRKHRRNRH
jgi:hypothetical protein